MEFRQNSAEISSKNRRFFDKNCEICQCVYLLPLSTGQEHVGCRRKQSLFVDSTANELSQYRILCNKSFSPKSSRAGKTCLSSSKRSTPSGIVLKSFVAVAFITGSS